MCNQMEDSNCSKKYLVRYRPLDVTSKYDLQVQSTNAISPQLTIEQLLSGQAVRQDLCSFPPGTPLLQFSWA